MLIIRAIIALGAATVGYHYGVDIALADQWTYFEALRTTTSIVFGIMAALLAIIYPEVLKGTLRSAIEPNSASRVDMHRIVDPLAQSALLLIFLVSLAPVFAWIKVYSGPEPDITRTVQSIAFALFCCLSYWQVLILLFVIRPMDFLLSRTDDALTRAQARRSWHSNGAPPRS